MYNALIIISRFISKAITVSYYNGVRSPRSNAKVISDIEKWITIVVQRLKYSCVSSRELIHPKHTVD